MPTASHTQLFIWGNKGQEKMIDNKVILDFTKMEHLSVPAKTMLLEKGKVADRLYLIHKGCLRLYFYNNGNDVTFHVNSTSKCKFT